jgi:hypothetical protein
MLKSFAELSPAQKKYAVILAQYRPDRDPSGLISSAFVRELHHELLANRENGGPRIGWPRWVFVENLVDKSLGFCPFPSPEEIESFLEPEREAEQRKTCQTGSEVVQLRLERLLTEVEYETELRKLGIKL